MEEFVPFGGRTYWLLFALLAFARAADFISTWIATPRLVLEGNPIGKWLGWKWGIVVNIMLVVLLANWPFATLVIGTSSALVAARNFQSAWLMRTMGEINYRDWILHFRNQAPRRLFLFCLAGETALPSLVGAGLMYFSFTREGIWLVPLGVGTGMIVYAAAVLIYTLLSVWRSWRRPRYDSRTN